jgi:hypothetical protein
VKEEAMPHPAQAEIVPWELCPVLCSPKQIREFLSGYSLVSGFAALVLLIWVTLVI